MKSSKLVAYAMDFASFFMEQIKDPDAVRAIILFGSTARGDQTLKSDVDLFIDTDTINSAFVNKVLDDFYASLKFQKYWKLLGVSNSISCKVGRLEEWELKNSLIANGIAIYSKYAGKPDGELYVLFLVEVKGLHKDKVRVWRKLYGYKQKVKDKTYVLPGLIERLGGKRLSPSAFSIPAARSYEMQDFLSKNSLTYQRIDIWTSNLGTPQK